MKQTLYTIYDIYRSIQAWVIGRSDVINDDGVQLQVMVFKHVV